MVILIGTMMDVAQQNYRTGPDWSQQAEEIHCPLCGYNLRGLTEPRCPECGHQFEWAKLLDPKQWTHPYLFEHRPERNVRSFFSTMFHGFAPWRFWKTLRPEMRSNARRLIAYWILTMSGVLLACAAMIMVVGVQLYVENEAFRPIWTQMLTAPTGAARAAYGNAVIQRAGSLQAAIDERCPPVLSTRFAGYVLQLWDPRAWYFMGLGTLLLIIWPWLTTGVLMLYRQSLRQGRVRAIHLLRCTIYCADIIVGYGMISLMAAIVLSLRAAPNQPTLLLARMLSRFMEITALAGAMFAGVRLIFAHRYYLRLKHSAIDVLASQVIVVLIVLIALVYLPGVWEWLMWVLLIFRHA